MDQNSIMSVMTFSELLKNRSKSTVEKPKKIKNIVRRQKSGQKVVFIVIIYYICPRKTTTQHELWKIVEMSFGSMKLAQWSLDARIRISRRFSSRWG